MVLHIAPFEVGNNSLLKQIKKGIDVRGQVLEDRPNEARCRRLLTITGSERARSCWLPPRYRAATEVERDLLPHRDHPTVPFQRQVQPHIAAFCLPVLARVFF